MITKLVIGISWLAFWVFFFQLINGDTTQGGIGVGVTLVTFLTALIVGALQKKAARDRTWTEGDRQLATITGLRQIGGNEFAARVELKVQVKGSGGDLRSATVEGGVSLVRIPEVQPSRKVMVAIDRKDPSRLVLDPSLRN